MSFIGDLFGSSDHGIPAAQPTPVAATPKISDAASHSAAMAEAARLSQRMGTDKTLLASAGGLGDSGYPTGNISRTTALGGNSSLTPTA